MSHGKMYKRSQVTAVQHSW